MPQIVPPLVAHLDTGMGSLIWARKIVADRVPAMYLVESRPMRCRRMSAANARHVASLPFCALAKDLALVSFEEPLESLLQLLPPLALTYAHGHLVTLVGLSSYAPHPRMSTANHRLEYVRRSLRMQRRPTCLPEATHRAQGRTSSQLK
jgi:hypothetical protein